MPLEGRWRRHWRRQGKCARTIWVYALILAPVGFLINVATTVTATPAVIALHAVVMFLVAPVAISVAQLMLETPLVYLERMPGDDTAAELGLRVLAQALGLTVTLFLTVVVLEAVTPLTNLLAGPLISAVALVLAFLVIMTLYDGYRHRESALLRLRSLQAEANLQHLAEQVQPHFLYNALNILAELIHLDPIKGAAGVVALAGVYQRVVDLGERRTVPLADELLLVRDYLAIQQLRFGPTLTVTYQLAPGAEALALPPFTVFNLVENAIKHGIAHRPERGTIAVTARPDGGGWQVLVTSPMGPAGTPTAPRQGKGLVNLERRLALVFGPKASFALKMGGGAATATVKIGAGA